MSQDLRNLFKESDGENRPKMKAGHENRFLKRLDKELPTSRTSSRILKVAASVLVLLGLGMFFFTGNEAQPKGNDVVDTEKSTTKTKTISLGDLSPDLRKVENYYVSTINYELSRVELTESNKDLVEGYLKHLSDLDEEYRKLNIELNEIGPNDQTINALIKNLQLRLKLLKKMKNKIHELKSSENEQNGII